MPTRLFRIAFAVTAVAIAYLAFAPLAVSPAFSWDKANHVLAFFVMAWLADAGWPGRRRDLPRWGLLLAYGLAIEIIQRVLPMREFSWLDFCADAIGILAYLGVRRLLCRVGISPVSGQGS